MPLRLPCSPRRAGRLLLCAALALVAGGGCEALEEPPDDSLRGAGSIDVPSADLRLPLGPAGPAEVPPGDAFRQPPADHPVNAPGFD